MRASSPSRPDSTPTSVQPRFATTADDFWKSAPRDSGWWDTWFNHYRAFILHFADQATQSGSQGLIIGGDWIAPALPSGTLADGTPSNVPADAETRWKNLIAEVRQHFRGNVIFAIPYDNNVIAAPINILKDADEDEVIRSIAPREMPRANWMGYTKDADSLLSKYWRMRSPSPPGNKSA